MDRLQKFIMEYSHRIGTDFLRNGDGVSWVVNNLESVILKWDRAFEHSPVGLADNAKLIEDVPAEGWLSCELARRATLNEIYTGANKKWSFMVVAATPANNSSLIRVGSLTITQYPGDPIEIDCQKFGCHRRYKMATLIEKYGSGVVLPDLIGILASDYEFRNRLGNQGCGANYPALTRVAKEDKLKFA